MIVEVKIERLYNDDAQEFGRVFTTRGENLNAEQLVIEHVVGRERGEWHNTDIWDQIAWQHNPGDFNAAVGDLTGAFPVVDFKWRWSDRKEVYTALAVQGEDGIILPLWFVFAPEGVKRVVVS